MTQLAIANEDVATLETAPTHYVEGHESASPIAASGHRPERR
jgi:hypothetical protein